ncbi:anti-sigma regulatory factor [Deltaproteobacteria bacterium TL4]
MTFPSLKIEIHSYDSVIEARQSGRDIARKLGFGSADQTRLATAISELTRNVIHYAKKGVCWIYDESDEKTRKIRVVVEDHGPGIPDIEKAMTDGYTTGRGLGAGLPATKRLVSQFDISSQPGLTRLTIAMIRHK